MKKILGLVFLSFFALGFVACNKATTEAPTTQAPTTEAPTTVAPTTIDGTTGNVTTGVPTTDAQGYVIALVTDVGNIDDKSFNEGAYNGVVQYAEEHDISYAYYRPSEDSDAARIESIEAAISAGAKIVVCPGYLFEVAIYTVQGQYPDVAFLLLDGEPHTADYVTYETLSNTHNVLYQEEQAGFLAGYAAVMDGYRTLGFTGGMAVPAVVRYGYGFVQGVDAAAAELGLSNVEVNYYYADVFWPDPDLETKMDTWYASGVEIVFACGGALYESVVSAAERTANGMVIGVDVDQHLESERIITSAMKGLTVSVYDSLTAFFDNGMEWPTEFAGKTVVLGAETDGIGLPTNTEAWRFETFTIQQYEAIFDELVDGTVVVSNDTSEEPTVSAITVNYE